MIDHILLKLLLRLGKRYFRCVTTCVNKETGNIEALIFAVNECALNTATREYVEALDASYEEGAAR